MNGPSTWVTCRARRRTERLVLAGVLAVISGACATVAVHAGGSPAPAPLAPPVPSAASVRELLDSGRAAEAEEAARGLVALVETERGPQAIETAEAIDLLVEALWRQTKTADGEAQSLAERAVSIKQAMLGPESTALAESLSGLANVRRTAGDYAGAREPLERALAIREHSLGPSHPEVGRLLNNLANLLKDLGDYAGARTSYERALALAEQDSGADPVSLARAMTNLGNLHYLIGDYATAEPLLQRAVPLAERALGPDHPKVALCRLRVANVLAANGDYAGARPIYEHVLELQETSLGPDHPDLAITLTNLGRLLEAIGDYREARSCLERALAIRQRALGPGHPDVSKTLLSLANLLHEIGDYPAARDAYERVLTNDEHNLPADHAFVAIDHTAFGNLLTAAGELDQARSHYEHALAIWERAEIPDDVQMAYTLEGLGDLLAATGDEVAALRCYQRVLAIDERVLGVDHPRHARHLLRLAVLEAGQGDTAAAFDDALRAEEIDRNHRRLTAQALSERQALRHASVRTSSLDLALLLASQDRSRSIPEAPRRSWDALVRSRALVLDEMAERHRTVAGASDPGLATLDHELRLAREQLANLIVRGPGSETAERYRNELERTRQEKESVERELAAQSVVFRRQRVWSQAGLEDVIGGLPRGSGLIAYARIDPGPAAVAGLARQSDATLTADRDAGAGAQPGESIGSAADTSAAHYVAFVLGQAGDEPFLVDLGSAAGIDRLVDRVRGATASGAWNAQRPSHSIAADYRTAATVLRRRVWDPLAISPAHTARLFIVPDGALNLIDFAALPEGDAGYVAESGPLIQYLSAERDLARERPANVDGVGLLALGGPDFDLESSVATTGARRDEAVHLSPTGGAGGPAPVLFRGAHSGCADFASMHFENLRAAQVEAAEIAGIWMHCNLAGAPTHDGPDDATRLTGAAASEAAFKAQAPGRRVLHLATHGFFLGGRCRAATAGARSASGRPSAAETLVPEVAGENPLVLSGLALAGANRRATAAADGEDGILTAEEIAALDLRGVECVVLSACDTGIGEIAAGEGVLGLRRAFEVAGARAVIMSLWPVDDLATRTWMRTFYEGHWSRALDTAEAVRAASLTLLGERRARGLSTHPHYWAGFVAAGQ